MSMVHVPNYFFFFEDFLVGVALTFCTEENVLASLLFILAARLQ